MLRTMESTVGDGAVVTFNWPSGGAVYPLITTSNGPTGGGKGAATRVAVP